MSPTLVSLIFGIGLFLIWWSCWVPEPGEERPGRRRSFVDRLSDDLTQAGYAAIGPRSLLGTAAMLAVVTFVVVTAYVRVTSIAACFALDIGFAPILLVRARARKRRSSLRDVWPDAVDNIASGVRAGLALPEALAQLATRGPVELRPAFRRFAEDYRTTGRFHDSLDLLKARLADPVGDRLVESLRMAREVAACCGRCPRSCVRTPAPGPSWRPGRAGRSTPPDLPWLPRGSSSPCCAPVRKPSRRMAVAPAPWSWPVARPAPSWPTD